MSNKDNITGSRTTTRQGGDSASIGSKPAYDGQDLAGMFAAALALMERNVGVINRLNVFPVPDGDTGVNMYLTLNDIVVRAESLNDPSARTVSREMAAAGLLAGRGNSGVILSQFFQGIAECLAGAPTFGPPEMAAAFTRATVRSYSAIGHPREGTILTVIRSVGEEAQAASSKTMLEMLDAVCDAAYDAVARTPSMLDVLRQAGLVDAGGYGLYVMLEGMRHHLMGAGAVPRVLPPPNPDGPDGTPGAISEEFLDEIDAEEYGFCTQFLVQGAGLDVGAIKATLNEMGESSVVIGDAQVVRVHVHAPNPDPIVAYGQGLGDVSHVNVQDMDEQRREYSRQRRAEADGQAAVAPVSVVAIVRGEGLEAVFMESGTSAVLPGGDAMNPSVGQILAAVEDAPTADVILLPNNANILAAANQAIELSSKNLAVVPSATIPQGIAALLEFSVDRGFASNVSQMKERLSDVRTGEVCRATRSVELAGVAVEEDQIIGLVDGSLVASGGDPGKVLVDIVTEGVSDETEIVTVFWGELVTKTEAESAVRDLVARFIDIEVEAIQGGQPYYHYLVSME
ncbi:MAG: DAK2 domain-containing protein [SAR202 cluster bacterium]|nr:DAK2 domain-containing protein [SAR202 cluster bacterium]MDP6800208.1 DAK2 domain-containing protein [SAR202 cluster bacterium]MQG58677.1 DAK2 domain-containing protein [SAR202 cluster bacterium]MQG70495.1 DAK2 domain-containing protein [SAR202 cluster bacterium]HAL47546.1 hypothetical protein [Dehalococcoidia bacterium]